MRVPVCAHVFHDILCGTLLRLPQLHFLTYQESWESTWSSLVSLCPLAGWEGKPAPRYHLSVLPPGGLALTAFIFQFWRQP